MCGRFAFYSAAEAAAALFGAEAVLPVEARYNIAPTQFIACLRQTEPRNTELVMLRWGLVPFWAKDPSIGNRMINARAENLTGKPAFRDAFGKRRCLVLADGFYEWRKGPRGKTPFFVSLASGEPFAFAGLWEKWRDRASGEVLQTATIVTTEAAGVVAELHQRMPVILEPAAGRRWLEGKAGVLDEITAHVPPLRAWPVDTRVNDAKNEGAELIEPVGEPLAG
jgi:putative SOS response-associated peptidase YedK